MLQAAVSSSVRARHAVGRCVRRRLASASAARARFASPTMPTAPSRSASWTLTLMLAKRTSGLAKIEWEPVVKSVSRDPTVSTRSASPGQRVRRRGALQADAAELPPRGLLDRALAGEGLRDRGPDRGGEPLQLGGGLRVDDPAAGDDQRLLGRCEKCRHGVDLGRRRGPVGGSPSPARRRARPGSRRRATGRPAAATAPRLRSRPGRPGCASPPAAR